MLKPAYRFGMVMKRGLREQEEPLVLKGRQGIRKMVGFVRGRGCPRGRMSSDLLRWLWQESPCGILWIDRFNRSREGELRISLRILSRDLLCGR